MAEVTTSPGSNISKPTPYEMVTASGPDEVHNVRRPVWICIRYRNFVDMKGALTFQSI